MNLSNQPPKGTADWFPKEYAIRKYIFDIWREICSKWGYQEYLTPVVEKAEIYRAKSGEDVGGEELTVFEDRGGRELALRPEMTPSVTRMVSRRYEAMPKPIRLFSIANFFRNQSPQRGRNREFWQLNYDLFGSNSLNGDIEILQMALEIMLAFGPPKDSFVLYLNDRRLVDTFLNSFGLQAENKIEVIRILDKWDKLSREEVRRRLGELGLEKEQVAGTINYMQKGGAITNFSIESVGLDLNVKKERRVRKILEEIKTMIGVLESLGYGKWIEFAPGLMRGFDYYDGMVFEVFDQHPDNNRSLFGGGRYNALAEIFGSEPFPAVGCAPGDETIRLFLESWGLLEKLGSTKQPVRVYIPLIKEALFPRVVALATELRGEGKIVEVGLEVKSLSSELGYADDQGFDEVVFLGPDEVEEDVYKVRDMKSGKERKVDWDFEISK